MDTHSIHENKENEAKKENRRNKVDDLSEELYKF